MVFARRALVSVSDKTGIVEFSKKLIDLDFEIVSTGGTARLLREGGINVTDVSDITGFPEMMDGRVKTLHPKVHGGILAARDDPGHLAAAEKEEIGLIDLVVVNLYPFEATIAKEGVTLNDAIENIDIGGPAMVRASAKNYRHVAIVTDPGDYDGIARELNEGDITLETRERLAVKAFAMTADYDGAIHTYLAAKLGREDILRLKFTRGETLRYGENWHQASAFYTMPDVNEPTMADAIQLHGKEMSYNNYVDVDSALQSLLAFQDKPTVAIIKHNNSCGLAQGDSLHQAICMAWAGDPRSAFGSVVSLNREMDLKTAEFLKGKFIEVVVAPSYTEDALAFLKGKSKDLRVLEIPGIDTYEPHLKGVYKYITGGMLVQDRDLDVYDNLETVTKKPFPEEMLPLAEFSLNAIKGIKSNAIVIAYEHDAGCPMILGMGCGQPNRLESIKLAGRKARENLKAMGRDVEAEMAKCVMASEAFFPFDDNIHLSHEYGITQIVSVKGSIRDGEVIDAADKFDIAMVFTGVRHFLH